MFGPRSDPAPRSVTLGTGFAGQRGGLGAVIFGWPALFSYGLRAALAAAGLCGVQLARLDDVLHAAGAERLRVAAVAIILGAVVAIAT